MLCVFFRHCVSGKPPNCFGVFFSSARLRFFAQRVFWDELWRRSGAGGVVVFCMENAIVWLEKPRGKKFSFY